VIDPALIDLRAPRTSDSDYLEPLTARSHCERLSALDAAMVFMETSHTHMYMGEVGILEAAALVTGNGALDFERIRAHIASGLDHVPRHRQRQAFVPIENHPVWVDDHPFKLGYHLRHREPRGHP
jgi:hypothetical protein